VLHWVKSHHRERRDGTREYVRGHFSPEWRLRLTLFACLLVAALILAALVFLRPE
jgi:hypothetical protein